MANQRKHDDCENTFSSGHALRSLGKVGKPGRGKGRGQSHGKAPVDEEMKTPVKESRNDGYR